MTSEEEIGKDLLVADLQEKSVVILFSEKRPQVGVTAWVTHVGKELVTFQMGEIATVLGLFVQPDGTLKDSGGSTIRVTEYLGKI